MSHGNEVSHLQLSQQHTLQDLLKHFESAEPAQQMGALRGRQENGQTVLYLSQSGRGTGFADFFAKLGIGPLAQRRELARDAVAQLILRSAGVEVDKLGGHAEKLGKPGSSVRATWDAYLSPSLKAEMRFGGGDIDLKTLSAAVRDGPLRELTTLINVWGRKSTGEEGRSALLLAFQRAVSLRTQGGLSSEMDGKLQAKERFIGGLLQLDLLRLASPSAGGLDVASLSLRESASLHSAVALLNEENRPMPEIAPGVLKTVEEKLWQALDEGLRGYEGQGIMASVGALQSLLSADPAAADAIPFEQACARKLHEVGHAFMPTNAALEQLQGVSDVALQRYVQHRLADAGVLVNAVAGVGGGNQAAAEKVAGELERMTEALGRRLNDPTAGPLKPHEESLRVAHFQARVGAALLRQFAPSVGAPAADAPSAGGESIDKLRNRLAGTYALKYDAALGGAWKPLLTAERATELALFLSFHVSKEKEDSAGNRRPDGVSSTLFDDAKRGLQLAIRNDDTRQWEEKTRRGSTSTDGGIAQNVIDAITEFLPEKDRYAVTELCHQGVFSDLQKWQYGRDYSRREDEYFNEAKMPWGGALMGGMALQLNMEKLPDGKISLISHVTTQNGNLLEDGNKERDDPITMDKAVSYVSFAHEYLISLSEDAMPVFELQGVPRLSFCLEEGAHEEY